MQLDHIAKKVAVAVLTVVLAAGCTGDFEELNDNPQLVTDSKVQPDVLFTSVLKRSIFASYEATGGQIGEYSQYYASQSSGNLFNPTDFSTPFNWYRQFVINLNEILRLAADDPRKTDERAMARIWKAWVYHIMTDAYGDIPYSEAALGVTTVINQPKYDGQEAIYTDLLKELKEAAAELGSQGDQLSFGAADILYQGNVEKWKRFANSLRLRLAIRARFANPTLAATHIGEVISAPLIVENSQNASLMTLPPTDTEDASNVNFIYNRLLTALTPLFVGFAITDVMTPNNDPRMAVFFTPPATNPETHRGRPIQLEQQQVEPYQQDMISSVGPILKAETYNIIVLNAAEVAFLRAEAALAGITGEDEGQLYLTGIQKSMEQYGIAASSVTAFLSQEVGQLSGSDEEKFQQIITQKFIALFYQGYEAYAEFRRTGYPKVWLGTSTGATDNIPRRLTYPTAEYLINEKNLSEAIARMGEDTYETRIWWDVRPGLPFRHPLQGVFPPN